MHKDGDSVHVSEEEVSGASKEGVVRWVLIAGTLLAIIGLSAIWITGALTNDPEADHANVSRQIAAEEEQATDTGGEIIAPEADLEPAERRVEDGVPVVEN